MRKIDFADLAKLTMRGKAIESARTPTPSYNLDSFAFDRLAESAVWGECGTDHGVLALSIALQ